MLQYPWQGPKWELVAACFSLKGGRADFLVEKAAELGAYSLRPILTVRSPYLGEIPIASYRACIPRLTLPPVCSHQAPVQSASHLLHPAAWMHA